MAAELPVCDVLCEAMEYLSKLGSNLRSRSENLKEKRISKNKLRNAHAIHKAAKKVLLICELSKKSLENVETGVRKVLSLVDAAQANTNIGGKTIDKKNLDGNKKFYYFNYDSYNLRISKKISINHFTCVKVFAKGMPESMQEKYPVFYDCKLKRLRRKLSAKQTEEELQKSSKRKGSSCSSDTNQNIENSTKNQNECSKPVESDASESGKTIDFDKTKTVRRKSSDSNPADVNDDETNAISSDSLVKQGDNPEQGANEQNKPNSKNKGSSETTNLKEDLAVSELIECFANEAKVVEDRKATKKEATAIRKKFSKIRIADDSSESDEALKNKHTKKSLNKNESSTDKENEANKKNTNDTEPKSKKRKLGDTCDNSKSGDSDQNSTEANNSENDSKPLIRCVNITKLLKPDIVNTKSTSKGNQMTKSNHLMTKGRVRKNSTNCINGQKEDSPVRRRNRPRDNKDDDEFWKLKRNDVKQFQPKKFTVNISKLPELNLHFLLLHNLQKITHGSNTICEVKKAKHKETDNLVKNIDEVKNALLNESESEDIDNALSAEANQLKNTLLHDSDSDAQVSTSKNTDNSNQINQEVLTDTAAIKDALLNESDSENNGHEQIVKNKTIENTANDSEKELEKEVAEKIKSALLNDSDSDKNRNDNTVDKPNNSAEEKDISQNQSDKTEQCESTQDPEKIKSSLLNDSSESEAESAVLKMKMSKQKRKHVIKSMEAKKSLLHYTSSSENEEGDGQESDKDFQKHTHKHTRRKSRISSSSLNEENGKKPSSQESDSQDKSSKTHSDVEDKDSRTIDQIDGTVDEHSNSSVSKVRK